MLAHQLSPCANPPSTKRHSSSACSAQTSEYGTLCPTLRAETSPKSYASNLPTSLTYFALWPRGCSPWRPDAAMGRDKGASKPLLQLLLKDNGKHARRTPEKTTLERMLACVQRVGLVGTTFNKQRLFRGQLVIPHQLITNRLDCDAQNQLL